LTNTKKPLLNNNSSVGKSPFPSYNDRYSQLPTAADKEAFDLVKNTPPSAETHPHTFAWFSLIDRFHDSVRASWAAGAAPKGAEKKQAAPAKKEEPKKEEEKPAATGGDDDLDLFGDDEPSEVSQYIYLIGKLN